eukprot:6229_1
MTSHVVASEKASHPFGPICCIWNILPKQFYQIQSSVSNSMYDYCRLTRYCARRHINNCNIRKCEICIDWKFCMKHKTKLYSTMCKKYSDNNAFRSMYGFQLYQQRKYQQCIDLFERFEWKYNNPLTCYVLASSYAHVERLTDAIVCYKTVHAMDTEDWNFITKCSELESYDFRIPLVFDMIAMFECLQQKIHMNKWNQGYIRCLMILRKAEFCWNVNEVMNVDGCIRLIILCYWCNQYEDGYEYILKMIRFCEKNPTLLPSRFYSAEINLLLLNMGKFETWKRLQLLIFENDKSDTLPHSIVIYMGVMEYMMRKDMCSMINVIKSLKPTPPNYFGNLVCIYGNSTEISNCFGDTFLSSFEYHKNRKKQDSNNYIPHAYMFTHYYLHAKYRLYKGQHKIALLLYRMALKENKYDPVCYLDIALLMKDCYRYNSSLRCLNLAQSLNQLVYNINNGEMIRDQVLQLKGKRCDELNGSKRMLWNQCSVCGEKMENIKKCKRCKSVYYCSKSHQKLDWRMGHRNYCKYHKRSKTKHILHAYFLTHKY